MAIIMINKTKQKKQTNKQKTRFIIMTITVNSKISRPRKTMIKINVLQ